MSIARIEEAFALVERGEAAAAADVLQQALVAAPSYAPAYVLYAKVCETLHRWPEALVLWQDAALLVPTLDVAHEGVLRATRVIAALQALDARTAVRKDARSEAAPVAGRGVAPVAGRGAAPPLSPPDPPPVAATFTPVYTLPLEAPPPPIVERDEEAAPPRPSPRATTPPIRLGSVPAPPATETPPPPSRANFGSPPAPPQVEEPALPRAEPAEPPPRASLLGGTFEAPPPPRDVFGFGAEAAPEPEEPGASPLGGLDLDSLIEQLNTQGRIRPREDLDRIPAPDLDDDIEDMVSETLARIYATQGQYDEAARIYELLAAQQPEQADDFLQKAARMRTRAGD